MFENVLMMNLMQRFLKTRYWVLATLVAVLMAGFMLIQGCRSTTAAPFEFKDSLSQYGLFEGNSGNYNLGAER